MNPIFMTLLTHSERQVDSLVPKLPNDNTALAQFVTFYDSIFVQSVLIYFAVHFVCMYCAMLFKDLVKL